MASISTSSSTSSSSSSTTTSSTGQVSSSVDRSGLTEEEAVTAELSTYTDQISTLESSISSNETKIAAYQDMQALLTNLETAAEALQSSTGSSSDTFNDRTATLTSTANTSGTTATAASSIMSVSVASGTTTGTHTVIVDQLATAETIASGTQSSESSALGLSGTFTIGEASGTASSITVTSGMSLQDIANAINDDSSTSGVTASIISVSGSDYRLIVSATDDNQAITMSDSSGTLSSLGLTDSDGSTAANVLQTEQPAILTVDGISGIERDTNDITDVLSGVTLNLTQADSNTTVTVGITNDTSSVSTAINTFVSAYNAWRTFVNDSQATNSDGTASSTATLWGDSTLRDTSLEIDSALTGLVDGNSLGAIGITLNNSNELVVDTTTLLAALSDDFSNVETLFSGNTSSTGIAESIYTISQTAGDPNIGTVQTLVSNLEQSDTTLTSRITDIQQEESSYETFLLDQYGNLEASISANNQTVSLLQEMMSYDTTTS